MEYLIRGRFLVLARSHDHQKVILRYSCFLQTNLEAIQKDQKAVLSSVAKALESSRKNGIKRSAPEKTAKPVTKKTRYSSESEEDSEEDEDESEEEAANDRANVEKAEAELPVIKPAAVAAGNTHSSAAAAAQISLAT